LFRKRKDIRYWLCKKVIILYFIYDHTDNPWIGGGGAVRTYEIGRRLSEKGHKILVVSGNYPGAKDYKRGNLRFRFLGIKRSYILSILSFPIYAFIFLKKNYKRFDVIVEDLAPWNPIFAYRIKKEKPVILQLHQKEGKNILKRYNIFGLPFVFLEKYYPKKYQPNIIFVSDICQKRYGLPGTVIPNGIEKALLDYQIKKGSYVLFIGRLDIFHKGLDMLFEALKGLDIQLVIAGKGRDEDKVRSLSEGLASEFVGFVEGEKKIETIRKAKFLVMPSRYEGQPLVSLESAALGKPILVSDIDELSFVVKNGFGISFRLNDIKDLREKLLFLWKRDDLLIEMGKKGREFAKDFVWEKIAERYEKFLLSVKKRHT